MQNDQTSTNIKFSGLAAETLVLLTKAGGEFPVPVSDATTIRDWKFGIKGNKLATILLGGRRYTSLEEISRFVTRSSSMSDDGTSDTTAVPTNPPQKRDVELGLKKFNLPPSGKNGEATK